MSSKDQNLSDHKSAAFILPDDVSISIIVSDWNADITSALLDGCQEHIRKAGLSDDQIKVIHVPGTYELPVTARWAFEQYNSHAAICIGCVIKGETEHDVYINQAVATGIMHLSLTSNKPVVFGVLTPNTKEQALDRAGGRYGNKGIEAASTALRMIALKHGLKSTKPKIGFGS